MPRRRRSGRRRSGGVSVTLATCFPFWSSFFSRSLSVFSFWCRPSSIGSISNGDGNEYKCENRAHSLMSRHTRTHTHTVVYAMCPKLYTYIFFLFAVLTASSFHSLLPVRTFMRRASPVSTHTRSHIAIFLIFTLSSIIKFYGFLCEQKENRVP